MIRLTRIEPTILFPRPKVVDEGYGASHNRWFDQPDFRRNPRLWLKLFIEGLTLHRRSLALGKRCERVLDLGAGGGWFSIAVARSSPNAKIEAVDTDERLLDWGRFHYEKLGSQGHRLGELSFRECDVQDYPWDEVEQELDLVNASFILSRCKEPGEVLQGIYKALKPGGWLIYHDATKPPAGNLDSLANWQHQFTKLKDRSSDPWSWRRAWYRRYAFDPVRIMARSGEPDESHVVARLEELFAIRFQDRRRAFLDLYLGATKKKKSQQLMALPFAKFTDDLLTRLGIMQGACRYILAQKR